MIGKPLAIVSDMRIGKLTDRAAVAETLLAISGEDDVSVPRKHLADWQGKLPTRFFILSNEPPTLDDPSGALLSRYIILEMRNSFLGKEDRTLDAQLAAELPGILNWAIDGWKSLQNAGRFTQPKSAEEMAVSISRIASPVAAFLEDECDLDPAATVGKDQLYNSFKDWCRSQDRNWHGNKETFAKALLASCPHVRASKERDHGQRFPVYRGLRMKDEPLF
jgi:putative DNA primase/helicase